MIKAGQLATLILALSLVPAAYGQSNDWHATGSLVYTDDDPDRRIDDMLGGAEFALGWDFNDDFTLEGRLGYSKIDGWYRQSGVWVRDDETHLDLSANLLYYFDRQRPFSPYVTVGLGYLGVNFNLSGDENRPTASLGAGFNWRPFNDDRWSLRGEYRARLAYEQDRNFVDGIFNLGVQYDFDGPNLFARSGTQGPSAQATGPAPWGKWYIGGSIFYFDDDPDRRLDDGIGGLQFNAGWHWTDHLTLEGRLGYADIDGFFRRNGLWVRDSQSHLDISANLLAFYERNRPFAPYLIAGIGYLGTSENNGGDENRPSLTLGGGYKWRIGQSRFSIRNEVRARLAYEQDFNFLDYIVSLGVEYSFGGQLAGPRTDLPQDSDGDGVLDWWDDCPDTPPGVDVTARGCEIRDMTRDSDKDRVPDYRDECPDTPIGAPVGPTGCSLDSDMDGVQTGQDRCPATRPGAPVDEFGCEIEVLATDLDGDGVLNEDDRCADTRAGVRVDIYGCEIRDIITLPGVNFASASDRLVPGAEERLRAAAQTLNLHPDLEVEVAGHTDNIGNPQLNLGLSDRRAKTVLDQLVEFGVDASRLTYKGYGSVAPIADNDTAEGRAQNRRVELRIKSE